MSSPEELQKLGSPVYWDDIYRSGGSHEWFKSFSQLEPFLRKKLTPTDLNPLLLHLGCGDSTLPQDLLALGYTEQVCVDFSETVIEQMRSQCPDLDWRVEDVRNLTSADSAFHFAIDKGTLDAMIWGSNWDPPQDVRDNIRRYVDEVARVMKPGGRWIYVTFRQPHFMRTHLTREEVWDIDIEMLQDERGTFEYFAYVMTRKMGTI